MLHLINIPIHVNASYFTPERHHWSNLVQPDIKDSATEVDKRITSWDKAGECWLGELMTLTFRIQYTYLQKSKCLMTINMNNL